MKRHKTRYEQRMARATGLVRLIGLALCAVLALLLWWTALTEEPPRETDRAAQFSAQEEYYRVVDLYGDVEGAVEVARIVFEKEAHKAAEDHGDLAAALTSYNVGHDNGSRAYANKVLETARKYQ